MAHHETVCTDRREFLGILGAGVAVASTGGLCRPAAAQVAQTGPHAAGAFRFVFLPDIHLMKERRGPEGMAAALRAVSALEPRPAFLVTGGDLIDSLRDKDLNEATELVDLFLRIWKDNTELPVHHMLGNHDAAGWRNDSFPKDHPDFGYSLLRRRLGMQRLFYSFDHGGWHFVVMHNIRLIEPKSYISEFDEEQLTFLSDDLAKHKETPTIVFGHFPPVSAVEFFDGRGKHADGEWTLSSQRMSRNPWDYVKATQGANVKAFFSGHIHRFDRVEAAGRTFICAGSVSGSKWAGHDHETPEGITIVDCRANGTFEYRYHDYGWNA